MTRASERSDAHAGGCVDAWHERNCCAAEEHRCTPFASHDRTLTHAPRQLLGKGGWGTRTDIDLLHGAIGHHDQRIQTSHMGLRRSGGSIRIRSRIGRRTHARASGSGHRRHGSSCALNSASLYTANGKRPNEQTVNAATRAGEVRPPHSASARSPQLLYGTASRDRLNRVATSAPPQPPCLQCGCMGSIPAAHKCSVGRLASGRRSARWPRVVDEWHSSVAAGCGREQGLQQPVTTPSQTPADAAIN